MVSSGFLSTFSSSRDGIKKFLFFKREGEIVEVVSYLYLIRIKHENFVCFFQVDFMGTLSV